MGPAVDVIDSGAAIARRLDVLLSGSGLRRTRAERGTVRLATSGDPATVGAVARQLLGEPLTVVDRQEDLAHPVVHAGGLLTEAVPRRDAG